MLDKNDRIENLASTVADWLGLSTKERQITQRAAFLSKADLVTQMVVEFTDLAGTMGREYARLSGEPTGVAEAIYECSLPRFAGDVLPITRPGIVLSVADRLDSLVGLSAVGLAPRANADPFALRRSALGLLQTLIVRDVGLDLRTAIHAAATIQPVEVTEETEAEVLRFITRRLEQWLLDQGERQDLVGAVLGARGHNPALAMRTLRELTQAATAERFQRVLTAYSRPARIVRGQQALPEVKPDLFEQPEEQNLWQAHLGVRDRFHPEMGIGEFVDAFELLVEPITAFFDGVFVMADNEATRKNRLAMLRDIAGLSEGIVDLTKVQGF